MKNQLKLKWCLIVLLQFGAGIFGNLFFNPQIWAQQSEAESPTLAQKLDLIEISGINSWNKKKWKLSKKKPPTQVKLEMEYTNGYEKVQIRLKPKPGDIREFKIEQQIETSMTINDEGPHLDLLNWKHGVSPWQELPVIKPNIFRGKAITKKDSRRFPAFTKQELCQAVIKQGKRDARSGNYTYDPNDDKWLRLVKQKPQEGWIIYTTGVSTIRLRIQAKEGDTWQVIHTVEIAVALGC